MPLFAIVYFNFPNKFCTNFLEKKTKFYLQIKRKQNWICNMVCTLFFVYTRRSLDRQKVNIIIWPSFQCIFPICEQFWSFWKNVVTFLARSIKRFRVWVWRFGCERWWDNVLDALQWQKEGKLIHFECFTSISFLILKGSNDKVSILKYEYTGMGQNYLDFAKKTAKSLKTLRHPSILTFVDSLEVSWFFELVNER